MIYIATHKKFHVPTLKYYIPLQVGAEGKDSLNYLQDNQGENISKKNSNFCELTGLYWIWKNKNDEYKGIVHYRRYFGKNNLSSNVNNIYSYDELVEMLQEVDIILPYIEYFKENTKEEILRLCCTEEIFEQLKESIKELYPDYLEDFNWYFSQNQTCLFNMMFCRKEYFDAYCKWLFDILFDLEDKVDLSYLNEYQKRLYGFLSERLLNIWVKHNRLKVKHLNVTNLEMPLGQKIKLIRRRITNRIRYIIIKEKGEAK